MNFFNKTCRESSKTEQVNITIEFYIFEIVEVPHFNLNWQFRIFGPNYHKKSNSDLKKRKIKITIEYSTYSNYFKFQISASPNNYDFLQQFFQTRIPPSKNRKIEYHHCIIHIQISLNILL